MKKKKKVGVGTLFWNYEHSNKYLNLVTKIIKKKETAYHGDVAIIQCLWTNSESYGYGKGSFSLSHIENEKKDKDSKIKIVG